MAIGARRARAASIDERRHDLRAADQEGIGDEA
jgi:hypothetical protein